MIKQVFDRLDPTLGERLSDTLAHPLHVLYGGRKLKSHDGRLSSLAERRCPSIHDLPR
jgi:hypothetical protein